MQEYRCKFCHRLLFKFSNIVDVEKSVAKFNRIETMLGLEIKCPKCESFNKIVVDELVGALLSK